MSSFIRDRWEVFLKYSIPYHTSLRLFQLCISRLFKIRRYVETRQQSDTIRTIFNNVRLWETFGLFTSKYLKALQAVN